MVCLIKYPQVNEQLYMYIWDLNNVHQLMTKEGHCYPPPPWAPKFTAISIFAKYPCCALSMQTFYRGQLSAPVENTKWSRS